jgi:phosphatidate cytidylyltransferase
MLRQRVITAGVLLAVALPVLFAAAPWLFAALALFLMAGAFWEWGKLNGLRPRASAVSAVLLCVAAWWVVRPLPAEPVGVGVVAGLWLLALIAGLRWGPGHWVRVAPTWRLGGGWLLLLTSWWSLLQLHQRGPAFLLSVLTIAWVADSLAYGGGRLWGRRKLAPRISPGKTWEGVACGAVGVCLWGWAWLVWFDPQGQWGPTVYAHAAERGVVWAVLVWLGLAAVTVMGDLFESMVKRSAGVKDASALLPGHGGVLDRLDALLPLMPVALWLVL